MFNGKMKMGRRLVVVAAAVAITGVLTGCNSAQVSDEPIVYRGDTTVTGFNHFAAADAIGNRIFFQEAAGYQLVYGRERPDLTRLATVETDD